MRKRHFSGSGRAVLAIGACSLLVGLTAEGAAAERPNATPRACKVVKKSVLEQALGYPLKNGVREFHSDVFSSCDYDAVDSDAGIDLNLEVSTEGYPGYTKRAFKRAHGVAEPVPALGKTAYYAYSERDIEGTNASLHLANLLAVRGKKGVSLMLSASDSLTPELGLEAATRIARATLQQL
jgi:hypothetical protein